MMPIRSALPVGLALPLAFATPAAAQSPTTSGIVLEQDEAGSRFGGLVISDTSVGFGTFVQGYDDDPYVAQTLSLRPSYRLDEIPGTASLILRQDLFYEFTQPNDPAGRAFDLGDTMLWLVAPGLWREAWSGITVGGEARITAPVSSTSRGQGKITAFTLGPRLSRSFGPFSAQLRALATRHFYRWSNVGLTREEAEGEDPPLAGCREGKSFCSGGVFVPTWSASLYGLFAWAVSEELSASLGLQYAAGWRKAAPDDQFTSKAVDTRGRRVVQAGQQRMADTAAATFDLSWSASERFTFSAGLVSEMPALTADNRSFRFPLVDFDTPANNYSSLYFDVIVAF